MELDPNNAVIPANRSMALIKLERYNILLWDMTNHVCACLIVCKSGSFCYETLFIFVGMTLYHVYVNTTHVFSYV